ncbi:MAG: TauD/TfdA family dioxygenase, partial [Alphaproteobacteria bacterium]
MPTELPRFDGGWAGPDIANGSDAWMIHLSDAEIGEIDRTVRALKAKEIVEIDREDAPLPILEPKIAAMREDLLNGRGFAQIRGFPIERYSLAEAARAFWAIGTHLGAAVSQNAKGHALGHVRDLGFDYAVASARGYQTNARLPYHTDSGDVVGLLSVKTSRTGGMSSLVSSVALYNAMAERRPDLALVLMEPTFRDRRDEIPAHRRPWYPMPVFNPHKGRMLTHYVRSAIRKAQRFDLVPRITPAQEEAFDDLDALAVGPEF